MALGATLTCDNVSEWGAAGRTRDETDVGTGRATGRREGVGKHCVIPAIARERPLTSAIRYKRGHLASW
jgi:hypothetical protein